MNPPDDGFEWMGPFSDGSYIRGMMKIERITLPNRDAEFIEQSRVVACMGCEGRAPDQWPCARCGGAGYIIVTPAEREPRSNMWGWLVVAAAFAMALLLVAGYFDGSANR